MGLNKYKRKHTYRHTIMVEIKLPEKIKFYDYTDNQNVKNVQDPHLHQSVQARNNTGTGRLLEPSDLSSEQMPPDDPLKIPTPAKSKQKSWAIAFDYGKEGMKPAA